MVQGAVQGFSISATLKVKKHVSKKNANKPFLSQIYKIRLFLTEQPFFVCFVQNDVESEANKEQKDIIIFKHHEVPTENIQANKSVSGVFIKV